MSCVPPRALRVQTHCGSSSERSWLRQHGWLKYDALAISNLSCYFCCLGNDLVLGFRLFLATIIDLIPLSWLKWLQFSFFFFFNFLVVVVFFCFCYVWGPLANSELIWLDDVQHFFNSGREFTRANTTSPHLPKPPAFDTSFAHAGQTPCTSPASQTTRMACMD